MFNDRSFSQRPQPRQSHCLSIISSAIKDLLSLTTVRSICFLAFTLLSSAVFHQAFAFDSGQVLTRYSNACGNDIVFSARDQIWSVPKAGGVATPLTYGIGHKITPRCSPDGRWIAYLRNVSGSRDVYVMPRMGGEPKRLTFRPESTNVVLTCAPNSKSVVFLSVQGDWVGRELNAYSVAVSGGLSTPLPLDQSGDLTYSPDGHSIAYTRFLTDYASWKRYDGGEAPNIFIYDLHSHHQQRITEWKGTDTAPMWVGSKIYFLSDRDVHRRANLWVYDLRSRAIRQVTYFADYDIDTPSLGEDVITFSQGGNLWLMDLPSGHTHKVPVIVPDDGSRTAPRSVLVKKLLREWDSDYDVDYAITPTDSTALLAARGDLFASATTSDLAHNLTSTSNAHEDHPAASFDGRFVAYTTDSSGEQQLAVRAIDGGRERLLTHFNSGFLYKPVWSPDGHWIAIHDGAHRLWLVDLAGGAPRLVAYNRDHYMHETDEHDAVFSPDSRWLAFSTSRSTRLRALHLYDVAAGSDTIVSSPMESDYRPAFSKDSRFIYFVSDRHELPIYADRETNAVTVKSAGIYVAALSSADTPPLFPQDDQQLVRAQTSHPVPITPGTQQKSEQLISRPDHVVVVNASPTRAAIDLAGLMTRAVPLPVQPAKIVDLEVRGDKVFYGTESPPLIEGELPGEESALHVFDMASGHDVILVHDPSSFAISVDGSRVLFVRDDEWYTSDVNQRVPKEEKLHTDSLIARIDPRQEWREMFEDSWRLERDLYVTAI